MRSLLTTAFVLLLGVAAVVGGPLDHIRSALERGAVAQLQEKVYLHTDNQCYFVGDTLWYKAYVVRAGDLRPTDMSRILYVELLTPDGLLVERHNVIVSHRGFSCGAFAITDSLYSGYYELRAYTRWMLNFNVTERQHSRRDEEYFYDRSMASDYFRQWEGLYSRVLPIYERPDSAGDYTYKRIYERPKQRVVREGKPEIDVSFYPEGGHMVQGLPCRVAFEVANQEGAAVSIGGTIALDDGSTMPITTTHMGRGVFTITPGDKAAKASFEWNGKPCTFRLPHAEEAGVALRLSGDTLTLAPRALPQGVAYGLSVLCRGQLCHFQELDFAAGQPVTVVLPPLPTGVCDVTVFSEHGQVLADRLFFVNNHDLDRGQVALTAGADRDYQPHERIDIALQSPVAQPTVLSVAVRDTRTDEPSYDDGNIMTDLLLSSELRGFVAHPAYYFEADDAEHRQALDLLMMVQGWRRYKWEELADTASNHRRYQPEQTMTVEGAVYATVDQAEMTATDIALLQYGKTVDHDDISEEDASSTSLIEEANAAADSEGQSSETFAIGSNTLTSGTDMALNTAGTPTNIISLWLYNERNRTNYGNLKREVLVEAELSMGDECYGLVQATHNHGRFAFEIPPFYGTAALLMKAYSERDSLKKGMTTTSDKRVYDDKAAPDYYVKRDLRHPVFTQPYSYYQDHAPEELLAWGGDTLSSLSMENDVHQLRGISVRGRRRGKRAIDYTKPAYVLDAYQLYNEVTDAGLSFGQLDMKSFPVAVCRYLFGNMGLPNAYNIDARMDGRVFYRTYDPQEQINLSGDFSVSGWEKSFNYRNLYNSLRLSRWLDIRVFTDYEPRNLHYPLVTEEYRPLATIDIVPIPGDGRRLAMRDRHIMLQGFHMQPDFYSPDYSQAVPQQPTDYRRTLYWNPNARTDANGQLRISLYNNSKETRVKVSVAGITTDGQMVYR